MNVTEAMICRNCEYTGHLASLPGCDQVKIRLALRGNSRFLPLFHHKLDRAVCILSMLVSLSATLLSQREPSAE